MGPGRVEFSQYAINGVGKENHLIGEKYRS